MSEQQPTYQQVRYNEYSKQRADLARTNVELGGRYDQWILTLSAGAIGLSLAFLEKIAPHPEPNTLFLIGLSWFFLIIGLLAGFISLLTAQYSATRQIEILDEEYREFTKTEAPPAADAGARPVPTNKYRSFTNVLNWISAPGFVLGVVFLCAFAYANLPAVAPTAQLPTKVDVNVKFQNVPPQLEPLKRGTNQ